MSDGQAVLVIFFALWLLMYSLGKWQFKRITQGTTELVLAMGKKAHNRKNKPTVEEFYAQIRPEWEAMLKQKAKYILHKSELFPVPANARFVETRMKFTPAWLGAFLKVNHLDLPASEELEAEIEGVMALAPRRPEKPA